MAKKGTAVQDVAFEDMIDIQIDSPFKNPVTPREPIAGAPEGPTLQNEPSNGASSGNGQTEYFADEDVNRDSGHSSGSSAQYEEAQYATEDKGASDDGGGNMKDVPPSVKNRAIKRTAETFSKIYQEVMPLLPKKIAKVSDGKINRMAISGELDLKMAIETKEGDTTVGAFFDDINTKAELALNINEEMREEWRECLEEVLKEKEVALTPMQQLGVVTLMHVATLYGAAANIAMTVKASLDMFKEATAAKKKKEQGDKEPNTDGTIETIVPEVVKP